MKRFLLRSLVVLLVLLFASGCSGPQADIVINEVGCAKANFVLPKTREPLITVANRASEPMVLTIPRMVRFVVVQPGEVAAFELPRYIMGEFAYFCLSEDAHLKLSGGNPFLCAAEPSEVAPVARSEGRFIIEPHDRITEVIGPTQ